MEKEKVSSTNGVGITGCLHVDQYLLPCTALKSKCIKEFNIKLDILNLREEKVRNSLEPIDTGDNFLNRTSISQALRLTINKQDLRKLKSFFKAKYTINRTKRQLTGWKKNSPTLHQIDG
jgi:hypothetical protein